ncbi:hypothetical protein [Streptomyces sp. NPDC088357]|uniref:hypothetical protein n=1 Tax=Streptomyces sp. NPDC088357 TaxID=3154655 RepID=UPI003422D8C0
MTERRACPPAPGPLEEYAARFDDLLVSLAQRRGLREYLTALLAPRDRNKTLTCLAGAEPVTGSKDAAVQRLQFFLDLAALFMWAPDTRILSHPLRVAKNELTAVTGVMQGTFTRPMPVGKGGFIQPTGKKYAINMATVGIWNRRGTMDEEFLFRDNQTFYSQIGLG